MGLLVISHIDAARNVSEHVQKRAETCRNVQKRAETCRDVLISVNYQLIDNLHFILHDRTLKCLQHVESSLAQACISDGPINN